MLNQDMSLLFIIDLQEKLINAIFNKDIVEKKSKKVIEAANILNLPLLITEQYPQGLGSSIEPISNESNRYTKFDFNALADDLILKQLESFDRKQIIIFGIETHICVYQTVVALLEKGYNVTVVSDACGSRSESEYLSGLDCMKEAGAKIKTTEMILFELLKSSKHPNFKEIQKLIKD